MASSKSTTKKTTTKAVTVSKSPTVSYNPKTGAKLKSGESVTVGGKTYTQGSTATGGTSSSKSSISTNRSSSSSTPKPTMAKPVVATKGYSTAPAKTPGMSVAPKTSTVTPNAINSSKSNVVKYPTVTPTKTPTFGNPFAGGFFKNVVEGASTAFSGAKDAVKKVATAANTAINKGGLAANASDAFTDKSSTETQLAPKIVKPTQKGLDYSNNSFNIGKIESSQQYQRDATKRMQEEDRTQGIVNSFLTSTGQPIKNPVLTSGGSGMQKVGSGGKPLPSGTKTNALNTPVTTTTRTRTLPDGTTEEIVTEDNGGGGGSVVPVIPPNPNTVASAANTLSVLTDNLNKSKNDPLNKYNQKGDMIKYTDTALTELANQYTDPAQALNEYNTNVNYKTTIDNLTKLTGKTINDVAAKITPVTNGITPPQTTAQYLAANNTPITGVDQGTKDILTEEQKYNAQRVQMMNAELETQKTEAKTLIDFYEKQEMNREKSEREKAQFAIEKAKAEFDAADAETEQQRIMATENLKNFLAKIGALSTDGASGVGLANLEQRYQAQRAALRSNFQLAKREIEINMNDRLNSLEEARDEKVFKLNQDLSKSEREINLDVMKLNHDLNKDILKAKYEYSERIRKEKVAAAKAAKAALDKYEYDFFDSAASKAFFKTLPSAVQTKFTQNAISAKAGGRNIKASVDSLKFFNTNNPNPDESGNISEADLKNGINFLIGEGATQEEIERFKTDREAQAFILNQI